MIFGDSKLLMLAQYLDIWNEYSYDSNSMEELQRKTGFLHGIIFKKIYWLFLGQ